MACLSAVVSVAAGPNYNRRPRSGAIVKVIEELRTTTTLTRTVMTTRRDHDGDINNGV